MNTDEEYILDYFSKGGMVIVCDDENRENEGDIIIGAQFANSENMNFIIKNSGGFVCIPITEELAFNLNLPDMCSKNNDPHKTKYTITIDSMSTTTGISAQDRATTAVELCKDTPQIRSPGHLVPLIARNGLLTERQGHTEASIFLCIASGIKPVAIISECTTKEGPMMRYPQCVEFGKKHNIPVITIKEMTKWKCFNSTKITSNFKCFEKVTSTLPITFTNDSFNFRAFPIFDLNVYNFRLSKEEISVISYNLYKKDNPLIRIHSTCFTGDTLQSQICDCNQQFNKSLNIIHKYGGAIIYIHNHEGRGIGLFNKIKSYNLQKEGLNTYEANTSLGFNEDDRNWNATILVLKDLNITKFRMITNNPNKMDMFTKDFEVEQYPIKIKSNMYNKKYLDDKKNIKNHTITFK